MFFHYCKALRIALSVLRKRSHYRSNTIEFTDISTYINVFNVYAEFVLMLLVNLIEVQHDSVIKNYKIHSL